MEAQNLNHGQANKLFYQLLHALEYSHRKTRGAQPIVVFEKIHSSERERSIVSGLQRIPSVAHSLPIKEIGLLCSVQSQTLQTRRQVGQSILIECQQILYIYELLVI